MKDMLAKIVEMDKQAQKIMDEAQQNKINSINEISTQKDQMKKDFLEKARKSIEENRLAETKKIENEKKKIDKNKKVKLDTMQKLYSKKCNEWVNAIVKMTIEG